MSKEKEKIDKAIEIAFNYAMMDGSHHKNWVIDQIIRTLTEKNYEKFVKEYNDGEDGPDTYSWDEGIAP